MRKISASDSLARILNKFKPVGELDLFGTVYELHNPQSIEKEHQILLSAAQAEFSMYIDRMDKLRQQAQATESKTDAAKYQYEINVLDIEMFSTSCSFLEALAKTGEGEFKNAIEKELTSIKDAEQRKIATGLLAADLRRQVQDIIADLSDEKSGELKRQAGIMLDLLADSDPIEAAPLREQLEKFYNKGENQPPLEQAEVKPEESEPVPLKTQKKASASTLKAS